jgi:tRNA(Ile)-lysidine synthase
MSKALEKVRALIERYSMFSDTRGVLAAVSGGPDSVALLDILARSLTGPRLHVAHFDHKLRGRDSAEDAEFVRRLAERRGLPITVGEADTRAAAKAAGRGIEEVARELRYDFLLGVARATGCDRIATGHTMSDQAETFLMRLARGAGLRGLASMRPVGPAHSFGESDEKAGNEELPTAYCPLPTVLLIRPLLGIAREEVEEYCREHNLEFRTDATNLSGDYTRNRVRRDVLPRLREINPRVVESIARAAEIISSDEDALDHLASRLLDDARVSEGGAAYSVAALIEQPAGLRRRMIIEAIRRAQATGEGYDGAQITSAHIASVESLFGEQASGKHITLPGRLEAWREFDAVAFVTSACGKKLYEYEIRGAHSSIEAGGFQITLERDRPSDLLGSVIEQTRTEKQRLGRDWMIVALDESALPDRLVVRPRQRGARAHVVGQRKIKKLKNLMIDHRIPSSRRTIWPVVTTPDDCYVWSPGLPPSKEFAARDKTIRLAILRASDT